MFLTETKLTPAPTQQPLQFKPGLQLLYAVGIGIGTAVLLGLAADKAMSGSERRRNPRSGFDMSLWQSAALSIATGVVTALVTDYLRNRKA
jgi:hypothetical protein